MNINLHIDSIALDGIDLPPGHRHALDKIVAAELKMLLNTNATHSVTLSFSDASRLSGGSISHSDTASLGSQLAHSVHASIAGSDAGHLHNGGGSRR